MKEHNKLRNQKNIWLVGIIIIAIFCIVTATRLPQLSYQRANSQNNAKESGGNTLVTSRSDSNLGQLFTSDEATITPNSVLPTYMQQVSRYGNVATDSSSLSAIKIQAGVRSQNVTVNYNKVIDLSYSSKDIPLVEFIVAPEKAATFNKNDVRVTPDIYEFKYFDITLVDIHDITNKVTITYEVMPYINYMASARVETKQQKSAGFVANKQYMQIPPYGTTLVSSFTGAASNASGLYRTLSAAFDYNESAVYASPSGQLKSTVVRELKNPKHLHYESDSLWSEFKTGEVNMSLTMRSIQGTSTSATVYILAVNGQDVTGNQATDKEAPFIRYAKKSPEALPKGAIGKFFPLFDIYAYDRFDGQIKNSSARAVLNYNTDLESDFVIKDGGFIPTSKGTCTIIYEVFDSANNRGEFKIDIEILVVLNPMGISLLDDDLYSPSDPDNRYYVGDSIKIPSQTKVTNGAGRITMSVSAKNEQSGDAVQIKGGIVTFSTTGYYSITYTASDYLLDSVFLNKLIFVNPRIVPSVELPYIPSASVTGKAIYFADFNAYDYHSLGVKTDAIKTYLISEDNFKTFIEIAAGGFYTPIKTTGDIKVKVKATNIIDRTQFFVSEIYTISLISPKNAGEYFYAADKSISLDYSDTTSPLFLTAKDKAEMQFINALDSRVDLLFSVPVGKANFSATTFLLQDSKNNNQTISISIQKKGSDSCNVYVNGKIVFEISAAITVNSGFKIALYDNSLFINDIEVCDIAKDNLEYEFSGFDSGKVFLSVRFDDVLAESGIRIVRINNQNFGLPFDSAFDKTPPIVKVHDEISNIRYVGDIITIFSASAIDVLDSVANVTVSLSSAKEGVIFSDKDISKPYVFRANQPDTYTIRYTAVDSVGNSVPVVYMVYIYHKIDPTIAVLWDMPNKIKLGDRLTLPSAIGKDALGNNCDVSLFYITESDNMEKLGAGRVFEPKQKGVYTIRYYAKDAYFNFCIVNYTIEVVEGSL